MTTQLAILNRAGASIGSDTLTTITSGDDAKKTIPNSHKMFDLGKEHAVLVLNSNSATINGLPVNALLHQWSRSIEIPLASLDDYVFSFLDWLRAKYDDDLFSLTKSIHNFLVPKIRFNVEEIAEKVSDLRPWWDETQEQIKTDEKFAKRYRSLVAKQIGVYLKHAQEYFDNGEPDLEKTELAFQAADVDSLLLAWLPENTCSTISRNKLRLALKLYYRHYGYYENECELGFVGYGSDDIFPTVFSVTVDSFGYGTVRWRVEDEKDPNKANTAVIKTWAQATAIDNFIYGFHSDFLDSLKTGVKNAVVQNHKETTQSPEAIEPSTLEMWGTLGDDVFLKLENHIESFKKEHHKNLLTTLHFMDVEELAKATDTLINIQILSTLNQMNIPTTGGLIELATIDRKNGVTWIRKL